MKAFLTSLALAISLFGFSSKYDHLYIDLPFEMKKLTEPTFPNNTVSIIDFGGVSDGITLNTVAFKQAMEALSSKGGGTLIVPSGIWYTGPITMLSNINLHLKEGAIILFSSTFKDYPLINTSFEGLETRRCTSPLNANGATNIAVTGRGTIDGNGDAWRFVKKGKMTSSQWSKLIKSGGVLSEDKSLWFPTQNSKRGYDLSIGNFNVPKIEKESDWDEIHEWLRPVMVSFVRCNGVYLQGVNFQNSPSWNIHPNMCENVILDGVSVRNPWYSQNGDGLDLESCTNSIIVNSTFDVGDDAICIKSGKDEDGRKRGMPTQNVIVDNCIVYHGHGGFVVGSEMSGGVKNISVTNCQFLGTDVGLRFKSTRGRGGVVENIYVNNVNMVNIHTEPLLFDLYYGGKSAVEALEDGDKTATEEVIPAVTEKTPAFKNIYIKNMVCNGALRAMFFNGLPEMNIQNIVVENASIISKFGAELSESDGIQFKNVKVVAKDGASLKLNNVKNVDIKNFNGTAPLGIKDIEIKGKRNDKIFVNGRTYSWSQRMVNSEMVRYPESWQIDFRKTPKWDYTNGLEVHAISQVGQYYSIPEYIEYAKSYADKLLLENGTQIATYKVTEWNIDKIAPAPILFDILEQTKEDKYLNAINLINSQLRQHPRTADGGFWHKQVYPNQMWLDGLFMGQPFYAEYTAKFGNKEDYQDIIKQFTLVAKGTYDPKTKLFRHAFDFSKEAAWANKKTGQSPHAWGRAMGWFLVGLVDVLEIMPKDTPNRGELIKILNNIVTALPKYADKETGLYYQVLDQPKREGNYLESTANCMYAYGILKAVRIGALNQKHQESGLKIYNSILKNFISIDDNGVVSLTRCCKVAGLGGKQNRDGSFEYYLSEPIIDNDPKGVGPFIWAALEVEMIKK